MTSIWQTRIEVARSSHHSICGKVGPPRFPRTRRNVAAAATLLSKLPEAKILREQGTHQETRSLLYLAT
jgi:hypothetical protein